MFTNENKSYYRLVLMGLLTAMSIIFGKVLAFNAGALRISFENLPILMAGIFLGAKAGTLTGICADMIGCVLVGYTINPVITLGAACVGFFAGLLYEKTVHFSAMKRLTISILIAHVIGSMVMKSIGLMLFYGYTIQAVALRIPLYIGISLVESSVIFGLLKNQAFVSHLERSRKK